MAILLNLVKRNSSAIIETFREEMDVCPRIGLFPNNRRQATGSNLRSHEPLLGLSRKIRERSTIKDQHKYSRRCNGR